MSIPARPLGMALGPVDAPVVVEAFLDTVCPFSKKLFNTVLQEVLPEYPQVRFCFMNAPQPWHFQSALLHEAILAVHRLEPSSWSSFVLALYAQQERFADTAVVRRTRMEVYEALADVAATDGNVARDRFLDMVRPSEEDGTNKVLADLKLVTKYHRKRGIHVTPTVLVNGIEAGQVSSSWSLREWQNLLDGLLRAGGQ